MELLIRFVELAVGLVIGLAVELASYVTVTATTPYNCRLLVWAHGVVFVI